MALEQWEDIKHFSPHSQIDNWRKPDSISGDLLKKLDAFRTSIGVPIFVTSGFRTGNKNSEHSKGRAADIVAPSFQYGLLNLYLEAERFGFTGIGIYRDWVYDGKFSQGLHLDVRPLNDTIRGARWISYREGADDIEQAPSLITIQQTYVSLDSEHLYELGIY